MGVSVDTSVLIDRVRGRESTLRVLERLEATGLLPTLSSVAVFELLSGVEFARSRSERARVELTLRRFPIEPFDLDAARRAGELRAELQRVGRTPGAPDVLIAGHALARGHTLVTSDDGLPEAARGLGLAVVSVRTR